MASQPPERAAVVIIHGIGEQPPISTLGRFAQGLMDHAGASQPEPALRQLGGGSVPLLRFRGLIPGRETDVMEFAWQHLVRGRITAFATLRWLLSTTLAPLNFGRHWRILASAGREAPGPWQVVMRQLLVAAALLLPALLLAVALLFIISGWLGGRLLPIVPAAAEVSTADLGLFTAGLLTGMLGLFQLLAIGREASSARRINRRTRKLHGQAWSGLHGSALRAWRVPALLTGMLLLAAATVFVSVAADVWLLISDWLPDEQGHNWLLTCLLATGIALLLPLFLNLMRDYAGDVAYYVTSDRTPVARRSRYDIRKNAARLLHELLRDPAYDQVVVVGHSLGTVIAFDALNELSREVRQENALSAVQLGKLSGLLTLASPLDKVAYFFREQTEDDAALHAQLLSYLHPTKRLSSRRDDGPYRMAGYEVPFRRLRWINVHAPADVISDPLVFYSVDELCRVSYLPLGAHGRYWHDARTYRLLLKLLRDDHSRPANAA